MSPGDRPVDDRVRATRPAHGPETAVADSYGPVRADVADALVYEEFSCEDALVATDRECDRPNRWVQSTVAVPIER